MRYLERCLYDYKLALVSDTPSDPVYVRTLEILNLERKIKILEKRTRPVELLILDLKDGGKKNSSLLQVLEQRYFKHRTWREVQGYFNLSLRTLMRRNEELINLLRKYIEK